MKRFAWPFVRFKAPAGGTFFSVKNRLAASFLIVLLVPALCLTWNSYQTAKKKVDEQVTMAAEVSVRLLNNVFSEFIVAKQQDVAGLAYGMELAGMKSLDGGNIGSSPNVRKQLEGYRAVHPEIEQVYVGTEDGLFMNAPDSFKNPPDYDPRKRPWYQQAMANKDKVIVTAPYVSKSSNQQVVTVAQATKDGQGVAAINVGIGQLAEITRSVQIGREGYIYILDQDGKMIVHPQVAPGTDVSAEPTTVILYKSGSGYFTYLSGKDPKKMVFATNAQTGWKIAGTMYEREVADEASPILHRTVIVLIVALLLGGLLLYWVIYSIIRPLKQMNRVSMKITEGDLTEQITVTREDELGRLGNSFNEMSRSLRSVIYQVSENAIQLSASAEQLATSSEVSSEASEQIAAAMQEAASGTEQQVRSTEETQQAMTEMERQVDRIAAHAEHAASSASHAKERAAEGNEAIQRAVNQMSSIGAGVNHLAQVIHGLDERSSEIVKIIDVITEIAARTNLLALNAAIEAARAGEHGRGFAVVSQEIRKLAEQCSESAKQISGLIGGMRQETDATIVNMQNVKLEVQEGVKAVQTAGSSFEEITVSVDALVEQIGETAAVSHSMSDSSRKVASAMDVVTEVSEGTAGRIQQVAGITEEQLASMEEITASANALTKMAEDLQALIDKFKV